MDKPMALPRRENAMIGFRPARSEIWGHRKSPKSIPRGYADVSAPKLGPTSRLKWVPSSGVMGPAMVKPSRLRNAADSTATTPTGIRSACGDEFAAAAPPPPGATLRSKTFLERDGC